jgi:localization factor PodJL
MPPAKIGPQSLRVAAARGNAAAQFEIASRYAKGNGIKQDYGKAFEWYARAAAQSLAPAQYRLAALYERGRGVKKDPAMARVWYTRAAEQGNVKAMHNLAVIFSGGEGSKPDHAAAAKWFTEAARLGLTDSQFNLGILYDAGLGVKKNPVEAYQWFALAAARGDKESEKRVKRARLRLRPEQLRVADQAVRQWRPKPLDRSANEVRPPRRGWRSVSAGDTASGNTSASSTDTALVYRVQSLLNKLGYDAGVPDGVPGPQTGAAVRRFQTRIGLAVDGEITPKLLARLKALTS